jgi:hypothetical protein
MKYQFTDKNAVPILVVFCSPNLDYSHYHLLNNFVSQF